MENKDLKFLKKHYGENFAHLCRSLFPTILEHEGVLSEIISDHFGQTRSLYNDLLNCKDEFQNFVYSFYDENEQKMKKVNKTPQQLLDEAGYILSPECQTEEDIQSFKKYWAENERLCTFNGGRLESCRVWFAVKKNIDEIKRKDFRHPSRQDEYGTSAISIQFTKGENSTLSIKNRYNHSVPNPDSTFSNNLDNIIDGLMQAFIDTYQIGMLKPKKDTREMQNALYDYRLASDGKFYKCLIEQNDCCFCENNIVIKHGYAQQLDKARYLLAENYVIDKQSNTISLYESEEKDSFIESIGKIKELNIREEKDRKLVVITPERGKEVVITLSKNNQILGYSNPNVKIIGDEFLNINKNLEELSLTGLEEVGDLFLYTNFQMKNLNLPNLRVAGDRFLALNSNITQLSLPKLEKIGGYALSQAKELKHLSMPNLISVGEDFLYSNEKLTELNLPSLKVAGHRFLKWNKKISKFNLPKLEETGHDFLYSNEELTKLYLPNLRKTGMQFLYNNIVLDDVNLPNLEKVEGYFLYGNQDLTKLYLPKLKSAEYCFLYSNEKLEELKLPKLKFVESCFLHSNKKITDLNLPKLESVGTNFFVENTTSLQSANFPKLRNIKGNFLANNKSLIKLSIPKVKSFENSKSFSSNKNLKMINAPKLKQELITKKPVENETERG